MCEKAECGSQVCQANDGQLNYRCVDYLTLRDDEGDWSLLRRAAPKNSSNGVNVWHDASDNMMGSDVYGRYGSSTCSFSARFDDKDFDEFLFAAGDGSAWMVVDSQNLRDLDVDPSFGVKGPIEASLNSLTSYETQWWNRGDKYPQDPILYYGDNSNTMLYAEAGMEADELFAKVYGYNVYGRWREEPASTSGVTTQTSN